MVRNSPGLEEFKLYVRSHDTEVIRLLSLIPCLVGTDMHRVIADSRTLNQFNIHNGGVAGDEMDQDMRK